MRTEIALICYLLVTSLLLIVIISPTVKCKDSAPSKWDLIELFLSLRNQKPLKNKIFESIREAPLIQLLKTANDIVEPVVTAAEVLLLLEELSNRKLKGKPIEKQSVPPIHLTTNDQIMVFSGNNKLEVNHFKKNMNPNVVDGYGGDGGAR